MLLHLSKRPILVTLIDLCANDPQNRLKQVKAMGQLLSSALRVYTLQFSASSKQQRSDLLGAILEQNLRQAILEFTQGLIVENNWQLL